MGFSGISIAQLTILLIIVALVFGTKRLRSLGDDIGTSLKSLRRAMSDAESEPEKKTETSKTSDVNESKEQK